MMKEIGNRQFMQWAAFYALEQEEEEERLKKANKGNINL